MLKRMNVKKRLVLTLAAIGGAVLLSAPFSGCQMSGGPLLGIQNSGGTSKAVKTVAAGQKWVVDKTTRLSRLTVNRGAIIAAPKGHTVTMTVNGVEMDIKAGEYRGDIVLTVAKDVVVTYKNTPFKLRTAIDVDNGAYKPGKSVAAAVVGGKVTNTSASNVSITSNGKDFNGIVVSGNSTYTVNNPKIRLTGNGLNDFAGVGAGIVTDGTAKVTVNNASIINHGTIRTASVVRGNSTLTVNNSYFEVNNGVMPKKVVGMMSVPWVLGLTGNCRATNIIDHGTAYYNNSHFKAEAWGVLSTDDTKKVRMYVTNCTVEAVESGYGAYSIGDCIDTFSGCTLNLPDYGLIMANEGASGVFTDGTMVNSGRFGVMVHAGNYGKLTIEKGSVFNTQKAAIEVKSAFPTIVVDNATLNSKNGILLQAMINDDPHMSGKGGPGGPGAPKGAPGGKMAASGPGGAPGGGMPGGGPGGKMAAGGPGGPMSGKGATKHSEINATFKNTALKGDIINAMTKLADLNVTIDNATITGAITTATTKSQAEIDGKKLSKKTYYYIGEVKNTYCATKGKHGLKVTLGNATWVVDKTSYLTGLSVARDAMVTAPEGSHITMTVDGAKTPIKPGDYKGNIVLTVEKGV